MITDMKGEIHQTCIIFAYSIDGGETWSRPERVTGAEHAPMDLRMLVDADTVHLIWTDGTSRQLCTGYGRFADENWELRSFGGYEASMDARGQDIAIVTCDSAGDGWAPMLGKSPARTVSRLPQLGIWGTLSGQPPGSEKKADRGT